MDNQRPVDTFILDRGVLIDINTVYDGIKLSLYKFDMLTIIDDLNVWAFNRKLNLEHIDSMYNAFIQQKYPHMMGTIKVVKAKGDELQVIDGQHRIAMIEKYINEGNTGPINVYIEVYHVQSLDHPSVFTLFKMANTNLNVTVEDDVNLHIAEIVNALVSDAILGKGIVDKSAGKVQKPRISKKELYELLKDNIRAQDIKLSVSDTVRRIKEINEEISTMDNLQLFRRRHPSDKNVNFKAKADELHFYLNLPGQYNPKNWIQRLSA